MYRIELDWCLKEDNYGVSICGRRKCLRTGKDVIDALLFFVKGVRLGLSCTYVTVRTRAKKRHQHACS